MEEIKFASTKEAIQHLADMTGRNVKIAWEDESSKLLKEISKEVSKNPAALLKLKKGAGFDLKEFLDEEDKDATIRPTNKGGIKIVRDIDPSIIEKAADKIGNLGGLAERSKILDYVNKNKEAFPEFHKKHKKGLQKDENGPYYRSKAGLLKKGLEFITSDGDGKKSKADIAKAKRQNKENKDIKTKEKQEAEENLKIHQDEAIRKVKGLKESSAKGLFENLIKKPHLKGVRDDFLEDFEDEIEAKNIDKETAEKYVSIIEVFSKRLDKYAKSAEVNANFEDFVSAVDDLSQKIEKVAEEANAEVPAVDEKAPRSEKILKLPTSSDFDQEIDNVVENWLKTQN